MTKIPQIIHQIWGGERVLPQGIEVLSGTWKKKHQTWKYEFWDDERIDLFVRKEYPVLWEKFRNFAFNIQRWNAARYLILNKMGGVYIDFDTECFESIDELTKNKSCWISLEPWEHARNVNKDYFFSNAIWGTIPGHFFIQKIIGYIFEHFERVEFSTLHQKAYQVMKTTGPYMMMEVYESLSGKEKEDISLIDPQYLSPLLPEEIKLLLSPQITEAEEYYLQKKMEHAYGIHYFFNSWMKDNK